MLQTQERRPATLSGPVSGPLHASPAGLSVKRTSAEARNLRARGGWGRSVRQDDEVSNGRGQGGGGYSD